MQDGDFRWPRALGPRAVGWLESDVHAMDRRARKTGARPGPVLGRDRLNVAACSIHLHAGRRQAGRCRRS
ncbi:MAG: AlpA family transcriptional regulator [Comamonadaceae bacterium]|nr:AlpA family transcriptional regulator [Comamonadaceae bacterium]